MNNFRDEQPKPVLLIRPGIGSNCNFVADAYPGGMKVCYAEDIPNETNVIIRWGTTTNIPPRVKDGRKLLYFNEAKAIHQAVDKSGLRKKASDAGLAPKTWLTLKELQEEDEVADIVLVRPRKHERSEGIYSCSNKQELLDAIEKCGGEGNYYISEYIKKDRELRVFVFQGRALMVFNKIPKDRKEISWGCVEQGALKYVKWSEWPLDAVRVAIQSFNLTDLDFGAVDVIMKDDKAYFLEVNTAPEVWPYYGERLAQAFKYAFEKGKQRLKVNLKGKDWSDFAHPTLSDKVRV